MTRPSILAALGGRRLRARAGSSAGTLAVASFLVLAPPAAARAESRDARALDDVLAACPALADWVNANPLPEGRTVRARGDKIEVHAGFLTEWKRAPSKGSTCTGIGAQEAVVAAVRWTISKKRCRGVGYRLEQHAPLQRMLELRWLASGPPISKAEKAGFLKELGAARAAESNPTDALAFLLRDRPRGILVKEHEGADALPVRALPEPVRGPPRPQRRSVIEPSCDPGDPGEGEGACPDLLLFPGAKIGGRERVGGLEISSAAIEAPCPASLLVITEPSARVHWTLPHRAPGKASLFGERTTLTSPARGAILLSRIDPAQGRALWLIVPALSAEIELMVVPAGESRPACVEVLERGLVVWRSDEKKGERIGFDQVLSSGGASGRSSFDTSGMLEVAREMGSLELAFRAFAEAGSDEDRRRALEVFDAIAGGARENRPVYVQRAALPKAASCDGTSPAAVSPGNARPWIVLASRGSTAMIAGGGELPRDLEGPVDLVRRAGGLERMVSVPKSALRPLGEQRRVAELLEQLEQRNEGQPGTALAEALDPLIGGGVAGEPMDPARAREKACKALSTVLKKWERWQVEDAVSAWCNDCTALQDLARCR